MKLIAIVGKKRSGKTTAAEIIKSECPKTCLYALAAPLKSALACGIKTIGTDITYADIDGKTEFDREASLNITNEQAIQVLDLAISWLNYFSPVRINAYSAVDIIKDYDGEWSIRKLMQALGTDFVVNKVDKHYWNKMMMVEYFNAKDTTDNFVITDIRQQHEIDTARDLGAKIIFIERDDINKNIIDQHITEHGLERLESEILIKNDGSIEDLKRKLLEVI